MMVPETSTTDGVEPSQHPSDVEDHGLQFTNDNDEWNGSISNGQPIKLRWNESIFEGEMRLFKISYPNDGLVALESISNWTEVIDGNEYTWTPEDLEDDELYALRIMKRGDLNVRWAISPPWKPESEGMSEEEPRGFHWTTPIGVPIVVLLGIYIASLIICIMYRRRKRIRLGQESNVEQVSEETAPLPENADRQGSVSSVITVQTLTEDDELIKKQEPAFALDDLRTPYPLRSNMTGSTLVEDTTGGSSPEWPHRPGARCECERDEEPRIQFWENSFDPEARIGQAK